MRRKVANAATSGTKTRKPRRRGKRLTREQIIPILQRAEEGTSVSDIVREQGISQNTFYRWKSKYGGGGTTTRRGRPPKSASAPQGSAGQSAGFQQTVRQDDNTLLKRLVADQALEIIRLKEQIAGRG